MLLLAGGFSIRIPSAAGAPAVRINEIFANTRSAEDPAGTLPTWIELINPSNASIDLAGVILTDLPGIAEFVFPANSIISAGGYLVVNCDPAAPVSAQNTGFALRRSGGVIFIFENAAALGGTYIDLVGFGVQAPGFSIGRWPNGDGGFDLGTPTRGAANIRAESGPASGLRINEWSAHGGSAGDYVELHNSGSLPVSLTGLHLTDTLSQPARFTIGPLSFIGTGRIGGFAIFAADDHANAGPNHLNFALKESGESIGLYDTGLRAIHTLTFSAQTGGGSEGLLPDGGTERVFFTNSPSPEAYNRFPGPLTAIVVNEMLAHTDPPLEDAIEFYNTTGSAINLRGFSMTLLPAAEVDFESPETYRIEDSLNIEAHGYAVIYQYQFGGSGLRFNSAHGGTLILTRRDENGFVIEVGEQSFGPSANAFSIGRYRLSDGSEEFVTLSQRSFGVDIPRNQVEFRQGRGKANPGPYVSPVVISELMIFPAAGSDAYIELRNTSTAKMPLYDPAHSNNRWQLHGVVEFNGLPVNATLQPGTFALIVPFDPVAEPTRLQTFRSQYQVPSSTPIYGPYSGSLQAMIGSLELIQPDSPQVAPHPDQGFVPYLRADKVTYRVNGPWPEASPTLQRRNPFGYGNEPLNWKIAPPTPGRANGTLPVITLHPQSQALIPGETVVFSARATGAPPLLFQWKANGTNIPDARDQDLMLEHVTAAASGRYSVVISGDEGSVESRSAVLKADELAPTITLDSPKNGLRVTTNTVTVQGLAKDDVGVRSVRLTINGTARNVTPEGDRWSTPVELAPGTNIISAVAIDVAGHESRAAGVSVVFIVTSSFTVQAENGMVLPNLSGTQLEVGRAYTVKTTASAGYLFSSWQGPDGIISTSPTLRFVMTSNLVLTAHFVPNPFQSRSGLYQGLFFDSPPTLTGSGFISLKLTPAGTWSGTLRRGLTTAKMTGTFNPQGHSTNEASFGAQGSITLAMALDLVSSSNQLTGRVTGGDSEASLLGFRAYANPAAPYARAGAYTFVISGTNDTGRFAGDSFGSLTVDTKGGLTLACSLANTERFTQKTFASANDQWPVYLPLDAGRGLLAGWVALGEFAQEDAHGSLIWIELPNPARLFYPDGFTNEVIFSGSRYSATRHASGRLVGFESGTLLFENSGSSPVSDSIHWGTDNRITSDAGRPLVFRITTKTGLYTGQWTAPDGSVIAFRGAIHQAGDFASGYFNSSNVTGRAWIRSSK